MSNLRQATANRLCGCNPAPSPCFPEEVMPLSIFEDLMYKTAYSAGYIGSKTDFREDLANSLNGASQISGMVIQKGSIEDFPDIGLENAVYIDTERNQIYYWKDDGYYRIDNGSGGEGGLEFGTILYGGSASTKF